MPMKFIAPIIPASVVPLSETSVPKTFNEVVIIPGLNDPGTTTNFMSLGQIFYNPVSLNPGLSILDVDGSCRWSSSFSIESEAAIQANVRKFRMVFYLSNPESTPVPHIDASIANPSQYYNSHQEAMYVGSSAPTGMAARGSTTRGASPNPSTRTIEHAAVDPSLNTVDDGRVKVVDISLDITDQMVTDYNLWVQQEASKTISGIATIAPLPTQIWTAQVTKAVSIQSTALMSTAIAIDNSVNGVSMQAVESVLATPQSTPQAAKVEALAAGSDPGQHINTFYSVGQTGGAPAPRGAIQYSLHGVGLNSVKQSSFTAAPQTSGYEPAQMSQNTTTQKMNTGFAGSGALQDLYATSYQANPGSLTRAAPSVQEITFESTTIEYGTEIDVDFSTINPRTQKFWVRVELLDKNNFPKISKVFTINLREQITPMLIPTIPPNLSITEYAEDTATLEVEQQDPMATDVSIYRMIANPESLTEASWTHVGDLTQNISQPGLTINDSTLQGNVSPKVVVYEARCAGPFGGICPSTDTQIKMGVTKSVHVPDLGGTVGECSIIPSQDPKGRGIKIIVTDIPNDVATVFLKKDHINTSLRTENYRKHPFIRVAGSDPVRHDQPTANRSGPIEFYDPDVADRGIYRYYAQFDWNSSASTKAGRTNSITDEYIQFVAPPEQPILSYMQNMTVGTDADSIPVVSFEFGASLSNEGIEELNNALGNTGTSAIFIEELKKDRSLLSNLVMCSITRTNKSTADSFTWPLSPSGLFIDSKNTNRSLGVDVPDLKMGTTYVYEVKVHMVAPEGFFTEALMKMPASTQQIITNSDPNFIQVSAALFSENFSKEPGVMNSPTTLQKEMQSTVYRDKVLANYIGISHTLMSTVPKVYPQVSSFKVKREVNIGAAANALSWNVSGNLRDIMYFQVNVVFPEKSFPLAKISPNCGQEGRYSYRDELYCHEISPVSYELLVTYSDMTESSSLMTEKIEGGSTTPVSMLNAALVSQKKYVPQINISKGTEINNLELFHEMTIAQNPMLAGFIPSISIGPTVSSDPENLATYNRAKASYSNKHVTADISRNNPKIDAKRGRLSEQKKSDENKKATKNSRMNKTREDK